MRSSTVASIVTVLLSIHGAAALNHRRYPTTLSTHIITATQTVSRRHDHEGGNRGENKDRDDGGEYGFGGNYEDDKPESTPFANDEEDKSSKSKSTQSVAVTVSEETIAASSAAAPAERTATEAVSLPVPSASEATENEKNISTDDNGNLQASGEAGGNGNG